MTRFQEIEVCNLNAGDEFVVSKKLENSYRFEGASKLNPYEVKCYNMTANKTEFLPRYAKVYKVIS